MAAPCVAPCAAAPPNRGAQRRRSSGSCGRGDHRRRLQSLPPPLPPLPSPSLPSPPPPSPPPPCREGGQLYRDVYRLAADGGGSGHQPDQPMPDPQLVDGAERPLGPCGRRFPVSAVNDTSCEVYADLLCPRRHGGSPPLISLARPFLGPARPVERARERERGRRPSRGPRGARARERGGKREGKAGGGCGCEEPERGAGLCARGGGGRRGRLGEVGARAEEGWTSSTASANVLAGRQARSRPCRPMGAAARVVGVRGAQ